MTVKHHGEAPGRVNLIGEHTDYNEGFVLPTAIPQTTRVEITPEQGGVVDVETALDTGLLHCRYELGGEAPHHDWRDYIQGTTALLAKDGRRLTGFKAKIDSSVPLGAGLSSSAALLVALLKALRSAYSLPLDDVAVARFAQRVENEFVGARVGIMDQMAASLAGLGTALFLDTRDLTYRRVALPSAQADLFVINSGVKHSNAHGGYNTRRAECESACQLLGLRSLRELTVADLGRLAGLPATLARRARHVVTENARVLAAVEAMAAGDVVALGRLFGQSHASMRDDYEVSAPEVDRLVETAQADLDVFGARMTGGGFGGSIVGFAKHGTGGATARRVATAYGKQTGQSPTVLVPECGVHIACD